MEEDSGGQMGVGSRGLSKENDIKLSYTWTAFHKISLSERRQMWKGWGMKKKAKPQTQTSKTQAEKWKLY